MDVAVLKRQALAAEELLNEWGKCAGPLHERWIYEPLTGFRSRHYDGLFQQQPGFEDWTVIGDTIFYELKRVLCVRERLSYERQSKLARRQWSGMHQAPAAPGALTAPICTSTPNMSIYSRSR